MAEETKPPVPPKDPLPTLSPEDTIRKMREELKMAEKQYASKMNFGPGKKGKIKFKIPRFPRDWKLPDMKTINKNGKLVWKQGATYELTHAEIADIIGRFSTRISFETRARTGANPVDMDVSSNGNLF